MGSPLDREKLDNLHLRLRDLERATADLLRSMEQLRSEIRGLREDTTEFKAVYSLTLYHAIGRRVLGLTGADLKAVLMYVSLLTLVLYALISGLNLFTSGVLPALLGGAK